MSYRCLARIKLLAATLGVAAIEGAYAQERHRVG